MQLLDWQWWKENLQLVGITGLITSAVVWGLRQFTTWWRRPDVEIDCTRNSLGILVLLRFFSAGSPTAVKDFLFIYNGSVHKPYLARSFYIAPLIPVAAPDEDLMSHPDIPSLTTLKRWVLIEGLPASLPDPFPFTIIIKLRRRRRIRKRCKLPLSKIGLM